MTTDTKDELDIDNEFLVNEENADPNQQYIKPNYIETTLTSDKKQECRDIVLTINKYGVSQRQKLFLVYLLALELENMNLVRGIAKLVGEVQDTFGQKLVVPKKKLILK